MVEALASEKEKENDLFSEFLSLLDTDILDQTVQELDRSVTAAIDCTQCGNCCRSLMINVSEPEANEVAAHLGKSRDIFDQQYLEKGSEGRMIINTIPCHFLSGNRCSIYAYRFSGCREFPGLHIPGFNKRLFTVFMHYGRCPIIFNVVELLKTDTGFIKSMQ